MPRALIRKRCKGCARWSLLPKARKFHSPACLIAWRKRFYRGAWNQGPRPWRWDSARGSAARRTYVATQKTFDKPSWGKERYERLRAGGICSQCAVGVAVRFARCVECRKKQAAYFKRRHDQMRQERMAS